MSTADLHTLHRPPREWPPPVPTEQLRIAAPPTVPTPASGSVLQTLMPLVGGVGLFGFAIVYGNVPFLFIALAMMLLMLAFSIGMRASQARAVRRRRAQEAGRYVSYLRERDQELAEARDRQRKALARLSPDPGALRTEMVKRRNVWERRIDHRDFFHVRIGTGAVELSRLPHVAGMITNLQRDLSLVDRMHDALLGEQERRQTTLREADNLDDAIA